MVNGILNVSKAEFAHDIQVGLARKSVPEFDQLPIIGFAAKLALNIRGLGEIDAQVLRQVADHFFDIPAVLIKSVLEVLAEVEHVTLIKEGQTIKKIIPNVPIFSSVYDGLGEYIGTIALTEHEELAIAVLSELKTKPEKRDALFNRIGAEQSAFKRVESITAEGGLVLPKRARGQNILVSPYYFADGYDHLAKLAAAGGSKNISRILEIIKKAQGWPLSLIISRGEVNGTKLTQAEILILQELLADGILKPPSLNIPSTGAREHFVFTPSAGQGKLSSGAREIYERAMALVAAVRKGQLLPEAFRIRSPVQLLNKLKTAKAIGASTEAAAQYTNLVSLRVGRLKRIRDNWYRFELIDTPENIQAVDDAIAMFQDGEPLSNGVNEEARLALQQDETYIQSIVSASKLRESERPKLDEDSQWQYDQLLLDL